MTTGHQHHLLRMCILVTVDYAHTCDGHCLDYTMAQPD